MYSIILLKLVCFYFAIQNCISVENKLCYILLSIHSLQSGHILSTEINCTLQESLNVITIILTSPRSGVDLI